MKRIFGVLHLVNNAQGSIFLSRKLSSWWFCHKFSFNIRDESLSSLQENLLFVAFISHKTHLIIKFYSLLLIYQITPNRSLTQGSWDKVYFWELQHILTCIKWNVMSWIDNKIPKGPSIKYDLLPLFFIISSKPINLVRFLHRFSTF